MLMKKQCQSRRLLIPKDKQSRICMLLEIIESNIRHIVKIIIVLTIVTVSTQIHRIKCQSNWIIEPTLPVMLPHTVFNIYMKCSF